VEAGLSILRKEKLLKTFITTLIMLISAMTNAHSGLFTQGLDAERERRREAETRSKHLEEEVQAQREQTNKWQIATGSFAVGCVALLSIGAALGAKVRRDGKQS
jgi:hypothetical protein